MSVRNLDAVFAPTSVALIGASNRAGSVGAVLARNLMSGAFAGPVLPVNPHERAIGSTLAYPDVASLPLAPDLAVIATPPPTVPGLIEALGARGCRAAVVITAGFGEAGGAGADLRDAMLKAARPNLLRIVGPNCLGVMSPGLGLNASFALTTPRPGSLALVAQSGAVATAALDWATARGYGFSRVVTLGDMADVDFGDVLDALATDAETSAILLYVESIAAARKFMSAARSAGRAKPVAVIKAGRSAAGARAALSHTGALAGADAVYDAAFRRAGLLRVYDLRELFDAVSTLTSGIKVRGDRLAIVTNGGGAGVMAADALEERGGRLAAFSPDTLAALGETLPAAASRANPVDILGDAQPQRYGAALEAVLADPAADAVLVLNCPTAVADSTEAARVVVAAASRRPRPAVLTAWLGDSAPAPARALFAAAGVPTHETPDEGVRAFMHLADHARNQSLLLQAPAADDGAVDREAALAVIAAADAEGRTELTAPETAAVLAAYGVPVLATRRAATPAAAGAAAAALGFPVALKILSPDISHKSDVGGVVLSLADPAAVEGAAAAMLARLSAAAPHARLEGFVIQPMAARPHARELLAGIATDATFGPVVMVGAGGVAVEVLADRVIGLPPLNTPLARDMIARTRIARLLAPYRDRPAADQGAISAVLVALSRLALDIPRIAELDINPLLADAQGVLALDGRIRLAEPGAERAPAIAPYPGSLAETLKTGNETLRLRAVRPQDAAGLQAMVEACDPRDIRMRFAGAMKHLPDALALRLSQIDYDREMALVAEDGAGDIVGVARLAADPEGIEAEFAILVRTDHQNRGLGRALMRMLIGYARTRGLERLWGRIDRENHGMRLMAERLGFHPTATVEPDGVRAELRL